jgi:chitinase
VTRQGTAADYANYPLLCEAIRTAFIDAGHEDWVISIAASINPDTLEKGYDMVELARHIDWFSLMSYDIHGPWDTVAGANADMRYIRNTMDHIFGLGVPSEKIVFGMAAYGRSTKLVDPNCITDGCPISGAGLWGCNDAHGTIPYFEIDEFYSQPGGHESMILNELTGSMEIVTHGAEFFLSYDSEETFNIKYRYSYDNCMRGIMW